MRRLTRRSPMGTKLSRSLRQETKTRSFERSMRQPRRSSWRPLSAAADENRQRKLRLLQAYAPVEVWTEAVKERDWPGDRLRKLRPIFDTGNYPLWYTTDSASSTAWTNLTPYVNSVSTEFSGMTIASNSVRSTLTNLTTWHQWVEKADTQYRAGFNDHTRRVSTRWNYISNERLRTREEVAELVRQQTEQRLERVRLAEEELRASAAAEARARELLFSVLNPEQRRELTVLGFFHVRARSGNGYRIESSRIAGNVVRLDSSGEPIIRYCCHLYERDVQGGRVLSSDNMLAQKMAIEFQEEHFLLQANGTDIRSGMPVERLNQFDRLAEEFAA